MLIAGSRSPSGSAEAPREPPEPLASCESRELRRDPHGSQQDPEHRDAEHRARLVASRPRPDDQGADGHDGRAPHDHQPEPDAPGEAKAHRPEDVALVVPELQKDVVGQCPPSLPKGWMAST
jgi:hypothetical protein